MKTIWEHKKKKRKVDHRYCNRIAGLAKIIYTNQSWKFWKILWLPCWIKIIFCSKCRNTKKLCMFCQHVLIAYAFPTLTTSHVSLVIQHTPCSFTINDMTYTLTKPKRQIQHSLLIEINTHTHKHFCLSSNHHFLPIICLEHDCYHVLVFSFSKFLFNKLTRLWDSVLNNSVICCFVEVVFGTLLHNFRSCYAKLYNVVSCLWQVVRQIMVASWDKECET